MTSPRYLGERFISAEEQRSGRFTEDLLKLGLGLQLRQLAGAWAGSTVYFEGVGLTDVDDWVSEFGFGMGFMFFF